MDFFVVVLKVMTLTVVKVLFCFCRPQSGCWTTGIPQRRQCTLTTSPRGSSGRNSGWRAGKKRWAMIIKLSALHDTRHIFLTAVHLATVGCWFLEGPDAYHATCYVNKKQKWWSDGKWARNVRCGRFDPPSPSLSVCSSLNHIPIKVHHVLCMFTCRCWCLFCSY